MSLLLQLMFVGVLIVCLPVNENEESFHALPFCFEVFVVDFLEPFLCFLVDGLLLCLLRYMLTMRASSVFFIERLKTPLLVTLDLMLLGGSL